MSSDPSFHIPGLGNLGQNGDSGESPNATTDTMGNEGRVGGASSAETKLDSCQASAFDQRPPGTSTYFGPPLLPPPTGNARPSFGITANVGDISARASLPQTGFAQFATKNGLNCGGTSGIGGTGSTANFGERASSASSLPSAVGPSTTTSISQPPLTSGGSHDEGTAMIPPAKPTSASINTAGHDMPMGNNMAQETNVGDGASRAGQKVSAFDPASRDSFSTSMIRTRRDDSSSGDDRPSFASAPSTNTRTRAMSVGNNATREVTSSGSTCNKPQDPESTMSTAMVCTYDNSGGDDHANSGPVPSNIASRVVSVVNKTASKTNAGDASIATQDVVASDSVPCKPGEPENTMSTAMICTGDDNSNGDNCANFGPISSTIHPNSSGFINPGDSKLGTIDVSKISPDAAIFCFGVLATQANFAPRFQYTYGGGGLWGVKLTFWGHTIVKQELADGKLAAKAAICRQALEALKPQFEAWMMPDIPAKCLTSSAWNWPHVLEKHCFQAGFDPPIYTKYRNGNGFRFEVEVSEASYFSMLKFYKSEGEAKSASAHHGLYSIIVNDVEETSIFPGAAFLRAGFANKWDEHKQHASRAPTANQGMREAQNIATSGDPIPANDVVAASEQNVLGQNTNKAQDSTSTDSPSGRAKPSKKQRARRNRAARRCLSLSSESFPPLPTATSDAAAAPNGNKKQKIMDNPNPFHQVGNPPGGLTKETHPWLSEFAGSATERRWNVSAKKLKWQTRNCANQKERVAMICGLLALQDPEYNLDLYSRGFGAPEHYAAAFFPNDPFLARAGAIGQIRYTHGERPQAVEDCAKEVANYLIGLVEGDLKEHDASGDVHIKTEPA